MNEKGFCESRNPFLCYVDKEIYQIKERNHHCERKRPGRNHANEYLTVTIGKKVLHFLAVSAIFT